MTTQSSVQSFVELSLGDFNNLSDAKQVVVRKFFGDRHTVNVQVCQMALNECYGGFGLSEELKINLYMRTYGSQPSRNECEWAPGKFEYDFGDMIYSNSYRGDVELRTDRILIDEILKLGTEASNGDCGSIYLQQVPLEFVANIKINEYDGAESIDYSCQDAVRSLCIDDTIYSIDELRQRLIKLDFLCIVFDLLIQRRRDSR
jgi:hypothetical protein